MKLLYLGAGGFETLPYSFLFSGWLFRTNDGIYSNAPSLHAIDVEFCVKLVY